MNEIRQHPAPAAGSPPEPTVVFVSDSHFHLEPDADERARLEEATRLEDDIHYGGDDLELEEIIVVEIAHGDDGPDSERAILTSTRYRSVL